MVLSVIEEIEQETDRMFMLRLYEKYKYLMFAAVKNCVADTNAAEDILQDALLKLIPKLPLLRQMEEAKRRTYIVYTVRNTAYNYLRDAAAEQKYMTFVDLEELSCLSSTSRRHVEEQAALTERKAVLGRSLRKLPDKEQELMIRKYYLKQSDGEIASFMGCKPGSVRMMLTRTRRKVLEFLREEGVTYEIS